ncbi:CRISPR type III-associated RAMP protein Csm3 [Koleobacter methoxysyntrophicus]|jgi:CRISPR-associated protein Csm3|uniref:CRISPR system Cms endoribonuclease Csm3 n=1 Tax=Koleobacter methoxysyntrophicus TaxID=2751313 RepID=A0A8A0RLG3_9FIRM|nr:type III-A CRISPR-associated RAMP protein Csm3 [Koleobacter methoxysyntrophicus]QSQ08594.1 CRISPR type III-associated RAMP protein Csm3 [Koleobacter methoxysyntrophicus]
MKDENKAGKIRGLLGKFIITGTLRLETGLHIGSSQEFSGIGAVDSVIIRDPVTREPYIPGSSVKGKMRYLLARAYAGSGILGNIEDENECLKRLFGLSGNKIILSRLQFFDLFMTEESKEMLGRLNTDLYYSEIKFENTISRLTSIANPRQIERVPAGTEFEFKLTYNLEDSGELEEDMLNIGFGLRLLEDDYIGGSGTRGYGRIRFSEEFDWQFNDYSALRNETSPEGLEEKGRKSFERGRKGVLE